MIMNSLIIEKCFKAFRLFNNSKYHNFELTRSLSTSSALYGKRNFRKFLYFERGTPLDHEWFKNNPELIDRKILIDLNLDFDLLFLNSQF